MNWKKLESEEALESILTDSATHPILIFKHSTRCSISSTALSRLERNWQDNAGIEPYYVDLLAHRPVSNRIAALFEVEHQSPQILLIKNGLCTYTASHLDISFDSILNEG